ncbi:MAG TPA: MFS transporter [Phenylobacterium sp.]|jgi:ACS family tartrate transporter-like MFS transporter|uniref:MFS transporter n=1 Tax=Phenylobacterium sp. TaxID=1871053 RepID=UPI002CB70FE1|nr:MFS transporter [Phenylobacterium sp.]HXA39874.1 MFS transporter [Phenylobacterium sp.]
MSDETLERSTLRKVAWRLLPLIGLGYLISYMDRVNISFAAPQMNAQLGFTASVYGFGGGLFFISYALLEVPSNLALAKVGARRWLARIMVTWGLVAMSMALVRTPLQFYAVRFLLGAAEAGFFPGVIYYLGLWFPHAYRGRAISRFYVAAPLASVVMGAVAGSLLGLDGHFGLRGWQWLLIAEGAPAVILSIVFLKLLPDRPADAAWLSPEQRAWLEARLAADDAAVAAPEHSQLRALLRPEVLALVAINFLYLGPYYAFTLSAPTILKGSTGLDAAHVGYLVAAGGLTGAAGMAAIGWSSDRLRERYLHLAAPLVAVAAAFAVLAWSPAPPVVMVAYLAMMAGYFAVSGAFWLAPSEIVHPRAAAVTVAAINGLGQVGSFVFPWLWGLAKDSTGGYHAGMSLLPVAFLAGAAIMLGLRQARHTPAR